ncbi:MAG: SRPBCC family protein [Bacteroidetes bacterium]|nr:SRPBCC family protein [Bacteroidota bacterium]
MHFLKTEQILPIDIKTAWEFFSSPENLKIITPEYMGFDITSEYREKKMYPGMIITYKVSPLFGIKMNWVTEITHTAEPHYFVDEQRFGPYAFWHHQHKFAEVPEGVKMTDVLHYKVKFGFIGKIANSIIVKKQLRQIFGYRKTKLEEIFGKSGNLCTRQFLVRKK